MSEPATEVEKCHSNRPCGNPGSADLHPCPYKREINDDPDEYCNCCSECEQECRDNI